MRLHSIPDSNGAFRKRKRVGRGEGSGHGKTAGRGHKGQKSRSGSSQRPGFESGHVPLYRRLPTRGFNNKRFAAVVEIVNLRDLSRLTGDRADPEILAGQGLVRSGASIIKILGNGDLDRGLEVHAHRFSASAREKIEKAGGRAIALETASEESSGQEDSKPEES